VIGNAHHDMVVELLFGRKYVMADYRCPLHDVVFQAETDVTRPGSKDTHNGCHPDCPKYSETQPAKPVASTRFTKFNVGK
jgi:hypothetical protein